MLAAIAVGSIDSCSPESRSRAFDLLFDEAAADNPGPVVRAPRHPLPPTPTPTPTPAASTGALSNGAAVFNTWDDVVRLLPKDQVGNPDWVRALEEKVVAPRPGIAPQAEEQEVLPLDVELASKSDPAFKVIFSHQKHGQWLACTNCHTKLFEKKAGGTPMAAGDIHGDRHCGACHGKVAFSIVSGCQLCHLRNLPKDSNDRVDWSRALADRLIAPRPGARAKAVDQPVLDLDVDLKADTQPAINSIFSHTSHTKWLACNSCHPALFPKEASMAGTKAADLHSRRYCGACHGSVAFGMIGGCGRCHSALQKARQHQQVIDLDIEIAPRTQPSIKTTFSHATHRYVECPTCHTGLFETRAGAASPAKADFYGGKYCATCHGKVTSDLIAQCQRCHRAGDIQ